MILSYKNACLEDNHPQRGIYDVVFIYFDNESSSWMKIPRWNLRDSNFFPSWAKSDLGRIFAGLSEDVFIRYLILIRLLLEGPEAFHIHNIITNYLPIRRYIIIYNSIRFFIRPWLFRARKFNFTCGTRSPNDEDIFLMINDTHSRPTVDIFFVTYIFSIYPPCTASTFRDVLEY